MRPPAMTNYKSDLLRLLDERGYIHQMTDAEGLDALAAKQVVPGYIGFDATAPSLHVGSLVQIMMLRRLQQTGHKPVVLMGGGTTRIGDPTGRDESRKMLSDETIAANIASIRTIFEPFLIFGDGPTARSTSLGWWYQPVTVGPTPLQPGGRALTNSRPWLRRQALPCSPTVTGW